MSEDRWVLVTEPDAPLSACAFSISAAVGWRWPTGAGRRAERAELSCPSAGQEATMMARTAAETATFMRPPINCRIERGGYAYPLQKQWWRSARTYDACTPPKYGFRRLVSAIM